MLTRDWAAASDRDYVIRGRHSRAYYGHADAWLKNEMAAFRLGEGEAASSHRAAAVQARQAMLATAHEVEA